MPVGIRRSLLAGLVSSCVSVGGLVFASVPALAAEPPEAPTRVTVGSLTETSAMFQGELNPGKGYKEPGYFGVDTYEFLYRKSSTECRGENRTPEPPGLSLGEGQEALPPQEASGLEAHTEYTVCLLARNEAGEETVGPAVTFKTLPVPLTITSESVEYVEASAVTLRAEIMPGGSETTYRFEYGTSDAYGQSTPESGSIGKDDFDHAASARVTGLQPGTTYHYRVVATNLLSPGGTFGPDKTFTTSSVAGSAPPQHCENEKLRLEQPYGAGLPDCRAYEMVSPVETIGNDATDSFVSEEPRAAVSGEAVTYASRGSFADPAGNNIESQFLSRRGPGGWSTQDITPPLDVSYVAFVPSYLGAVFTPELTEGVTATNASLNSGDFTPGGEAYGMYVADFAGRSYQYVGGGAFHAVGASTDLSHVVFGGLSEWVNGKVIPVGVANDGESMPASAEGWHAVSADGSRVFFTSTGRLYARVNAEREQSALGAKEECTEAAKACTVAVSAGTASYWGASADGSEVFFTEGEELDEYDVESDQTTVLGGTVQGVAQISEDGSYVYFVAKGALKGAGGATLYDSGGVEPVAGEENLYLVHDGTTQFIATLAGNDSYDWQGGVTRDGTVLTPDGTRLAFMSERSLTGYDNEQAEKGECEGGLGRCREVYLYNAGTGGLECASCDPTGARPTGPSSLSKGGNGWNFQPPYRPRAFAEDGALFFDSADALVSHASDGRQNVYEYEDGHVYAISNVAGGYKSFFLDASANGDDVFFATADQLLPEDTSNDVVVYDARVDGDSCKSPPTPQPAVFGAPASATFSGTGNLVSTAVAPTPKKSVKKAVRCAKGKKLSHGKCIKRKKPRRSRAKKSTHGKGSN
jgi:hypothetical protein